MHGLSIEFQLKRQRRINKIMNYVVVLAFAIFAFAAIVYAPYLASLEDVEKANRNLTEQKNAYNKVLGERIVQQGSSEEEIAYSADYIFLKSKQYKLEEHYANIEGIFSQEKYDAITVSKISVNDITKVINISYVFGSSVSSSGRTTLEFQLRNEFGDLYKSIVTSTVKQNLTDVELVINYGTN